MSAWYYVRSGMLQNETIGPVDDHEFLRLARAGTITPTTLVVDAGHTKGQWIAASRIPAALKQMEEGVAERQAHKVATKAQKEREKQDAREQAVQQRQAADDAAAANRSGLPFLKFLQDGQPESVVARIYDRVTEVLTSAETLQYIAVQAKPMMVAPDCIALTNRRFLIFRQKMLGQVTFDDYLWRELRDARVTEGVMFATVTMRAMDGRVITIEYLPKAQARRIYRVAQEREEAALEERRNRMMEETRAGAHSIVVNTGPAPSPVPASPPAPPTNDNDPMARLAKLKQMLDAGLIEKQEYDATKQRILADL